MPIGSMLEAGLEVALLPEELRPLLAPSIRMADVLKTPLHIPRMIYYNPLNHNPNLEHLVNCCKAMYPNADW